MTTSVGQTLLSLIEADTLQSFGTPLLTFLTGVQAANGDPLKLATSWVKLQGDVIAAAPIALAGFESQLAGLIAGKIQTALMTAPATNTAVPAKTA